MKSRPVTFTLVIAFGALIGILLGIGWLGLSRLELMNDNLQKITDQRWAKVQLARQALRYSTINSRITLQIPLLDDSQEIESLLKQRADNTKKISELLKTIEAESESNTERALIAAVWTNRIPYVQSYERALSLLLKERQPAAARQMMAKVVAPNLVAYHKAWESFIAFQGERMDQAGKDALAYCVAARKLVLLLLTAALILACAIAIFVTRETSMEIRNRLQAEQGLREAHESLERRVEERTAELRQANLEMQASAARLRAITNSAQDAVLMMDPEGKVSYWNPAAERILGFTSAEAIGQDLHELIAPACYHKAHHAAFPAFLRTGQGSALGKTLDLEACRKGGQGISVQLSLSAVQINGSWHAVGIIRDTTERKQAELEIQHQATFARVNPNPVLELSAAGEINYSNDAAGEMARALGLEKPAQMLPPNTAAIVRECLATGKPKARVETQFGPHVVSWSFFPVKLNDTVHCYAGDITERKRAEARVAAFSQLGQKLSAANTALEAGDIILNVADQLIKWDACSLDLYSPELDRAYHVLNRDTINGQRVDYCPLKSEAPPSPRARQAIETGGQLYLRDEPVGHQLHGVPFGDTARPSASAMFVPIRDGSKVTGILSIQSYTPSAYSQDSLETLQALADYCGGTLGRLRMQEELRQEQTLMHALMENLPSHVYFKDTASRFLRINPAMARLFGLSDPAQAVGKSDADFFAGEHVRQAFEDEQEIIRTGRPLLDIEEKETWPDGTETWVLSSKLPLRDGAGHIIGTCGVSSNITARKRAEETLAQERHLLRTLIDNVPDYIYVKDTQSRFILNNQAHLALLKVTTQAELVGKTDRDIFPPEEAARYFADEQAVFRSGEPLINREESTVDPAGRVRWLLTTKVPLRDEQGKTTRLVGVSHDITTRVEAEARLLETNRELAAATARANEMALRAESANGAKSEFLASMSHEIRTPMNGVMGMLGLLHDTELSDRQREFVQIARSSADSLLNIINDILDFSKIEAGKLTLEPIPFDLRTAVEEVGEILSSKAAEKKLDLIVRFAPDAPRYVIGDAGRIRQVLTNLVGNALKFTSAGYVLVSLQCERRTEQQAQLTFSVLDTGIGIAADKLEHIFEKFTQADASTTRRFGGTGLGLAISKQLTELMGGSITVTSQPGNGSTFSFTLPFNLPREPLPVAPPRTFLEGVRVLIVDDNEVNRRVLHEQVSSWRMRDAGSASGEEALVKLREARAAGDPYHLVILDYQMPGMDGVMLARAIKADPKLRSTVLVMLTSLGKPEGMAGLREAGIFACLLKPARQSRLWDALVEAWSAYTRQSPVQLPARPTPTKPRPAARTNRKVHARVLVVDDNTTNQKVARLMLENLGCRVDLSANGKEALEMIELLPYDAVFMDCEMPEMDGYEAAAEIRRRHAHDRHVPVIAMTAKAIQGDRERCLKAGMDDYISKPVRMEDLEAALARWVPGNEGVVPAGPEDLPPAAPDGAVAAALDPAVTARLRELAAATDPSVLQEIYETFLSSAVDYLAAIRGEVARNDAEGLRKAAHAFKGASANIGAQHLAELCRQLEALGEAKQVDGAAKRAEQLEQEFARVKVEIENQAGKKGAV